MKIGFLGDICITKGDFQNDNHREVLNDFSESGILKVLEKNDLNIGNLECPVPGAASEILKSGPNMEGSEFVFDILKQTGVGMVTLDNNHINDFGTKGIRETQIRCVTNDIISIGPSHAQTKEENIQIINGKRNIGVLTVAENEFNTIDTENGLDRSRDPYQTVSQIIRLRKEVDYLLVISHGGDEGYRHPSPHTRTRYRTFAELGVDVVIGHHTHCVQGMEKYGNSLIFYSMGNFFFPNSSDTVDARTGYCLELDLNEDDLGIGYEIVPYRQCNSNYRVDLLEGEEKKEFHKEFDELCEIIKDEERIQKEWMNNLDRYKNFYMKSAYPINIWPYYLLKKLGLLRFFFPKRYMVLILDLIRNESHRKNFSQTLVRYLYK